MRLIKNIGRKVDINYKIVNRVAGIIFNNNNDIALLKVRKNNYHVLPGGGIEEGEGWLEAFFREIKEEAGVTLKDVAELGYVVEYINERKLKRSTFCYIASVENDLGGPQFTTEELEEGYELNWINIHLAIEKVNKDLQNYSNIIKIIRKQSYVPHRESEFLKAALKII